MDDTALFTKLVRITTPWCVTRVTVDVPAERIDVWVEETPGAKVLCPTCRARVPVYDHTPEQVWRHLDTCQCQTYVQARLPRTTCGSVNLIWPLRDGLLWPHPLSCVVPS